jgi:hypothetical protein
MSYRLIIIPQAEEDIKQAAFWCQTEKEGLGSDFFGHLKPSVTTHRKASLPICDSL